MGKALVGYTLGLMMGPPLGGFLYERGGYQAPFIFCCIITLVDFGCRAMIIEEREEIVKALREQGKRQEAIEEEAEVVALRKKEREEERTSFWKLIKNKRLLACVVVTACNAFVFSGAEPTLPLYLASNFTLTSERIGFVFMSFSLPSLTAPLLGKKRADAKEKKDVSKRGRRMSKSGLLIFFLDFDFPHRRIV